MPHLSKACSHYAVIRSWLLAATVLLGLAQPVLARAPDPVLAAANVAADSASCSSSPTVSYLLDAGVNDLFPVIKTAAMSDYDYSMAVAASIQFYLQNSLTRDQMYSCNLKVLPSGSASSGYRVQFQSPDPRAARYASTQTAWLKNGGLGLQGVVNCQKNAKCWEPVGKGMTCFGPWQFYLPLGLPMISQKMVMLLHYPPYTAMQQSDYLNNATLNRWQRLLVTVGVPSSDWTLYTTTVDIFPIAAPGSGESGCFTTDNASNFFGSAGSGYIPAMLGSLTIAPPVASGNTVPVIIYGGEAIGYWNATYPNNPTGVNVAGSVKLNAAATQTTPYMGSNHPIAAVYQTCTSTPGIETMVKQDLTTACFAKSMGETPAADPVSVANACKSNYFATTPATEYASQICVTAVVDKSPQFAQWSTAQAKVWCDAHNNTPCPLPDYSGSK